MSIKYSDLQAYLINYVDFSEDKAKALQDISHLSFALYSDYERNLNEAKTSRRTKTWSSTNSLS
jgi:hypothetical protein